MKSVELEKALLGCIIQDPKQMDVVASWISAEGFFYSEFNNKVWKAINKLYKDKKEIDLNTISNEVGMNDTGSYSSYEISE